MARSRKLAAMLAADVVGYSRLMGRDESGTLARLRENRSKHLNPILAKYGGRLVKLTGDGALIEFASAVDALSAAIEFQQAMAEVNSDQPADTALVFRMGLHLGDLIVDGDDLYGDGVNIAARLEAEAPAGGILISRTVHEAVTGRVKATFGDLGSLALKNIERPVQALEVKWQPSDWQQAVTAEASIAPPTAPQAPLPLPDKPSIAVLPFLNMTGDPEQEYFTDGVTEDIITELSRFHSLFVIARNSSFSYKGKSPDIRQVGRELGVRYVLEGSIRKSANRIRVTAQLIDTLTANHIWAERYDRVLEDIFAVQEELTRAIVAAIAPQIEGTERLKATRRHPSNLSAYEIALRAVAHAWDGHNNADRTLLDQSAREAKEALAIDPNCVRALHALASAHEHALYNGMATDREHVFQEAMRAVMRAIELDSADAFGYAMRAVVVMQRGQWDRYPEALADARRAHEMNPNDTVVLRILGLFEVLVGEPDRGIEHFHQVTRLNPRNFAIYETYTNLATACFVTKRYADGIDWASRALRERPQTITAYILIVLNFVGHGEIGKAKAVFETLQN
ncbi:MAG TPA: adenylate/guanylate cyclase domain-containing protein, partial [Ktedonobacterales bacterium]|nr:adenylate/guanylate cyclase domain-containing protein [Ktedonobacterales bacterium]